MTSVNAVGQNVQTQYQQKKTGGAGKAVASAFIPGLGQFMDGRTGAGAAYLGSAVALGAGSIALQRSYAKSVHEAFKTAKPGEFLISIPKGKFYGLMALGLAGIGLGIANIVDAYRGGKK